MQKLGFNVVEKNIEPYDVYDADEAFITGTPLYVTVTSLNSVKMEKETEKFIPHS